MTETLTKAEQEIKSFDYNKLLTDENKTRIHHSIISSKDIGNKFYDEVVLDVGGMVVELEGKIITEELSSLLDMDKAEKTFYSYCEKMYSILNNDNFLSYNLVQLAEC